jgi:hypothetical protein
VPAKEGEGEHRRERYEVTEEQPSITIS